LANTLASGLAALRRYYRPFLLIQAAAVALVVAYYASAGVREICLTLAGIKAAGGLPFAAATAAVAGALMPEVARLLADRGGGAGWRARLPRVAFNLVFFAFNGVVIDGLYRLAAWMFGAGTDARTVAIKVVFDQFVFNPVWVPLIVALYLWRQNGFRLGPTWAVIGTGSFYRTRVLPLIVPSWFFWVPMTVIVYALPVPLQFLLFVLALAAWSLIMVFIADNDR
jgi:hypothetical protein